MADIPEFKLGEWSIRFTSSPFECYQMCRQIMGARFALGATFPQLLDAFLLNHRPRDDRDSGCTTWEDCNAKWLPLIQEWADQVATFILAMAHVKPVAVPSYLVPVSLLPLPTTTTAATCLYMQDFYNFLKRKIILKPRRRKAVYDEIEHARVHWATPEQAATPAGLLAILIDREKKRADGDSISTMASETPTANEWLKHFVASEPTKRKNDASVGSTAANPDLLKRRRRLG